MHISEAMKQSACLMVDPVSVNPFAYTLNYTHLGRAKPLRWSRLITIHLDVLGWIFFMSVSRPTGNQLVFFCSNIPVVLLDTPGIIMFSVKFLSLWHYRFYQ